MSFVFVFRFCVSACELVFLSLFHHQNRCYRFWRIVSQVVKTSKGPLFFLFQSFFRSPKKANTLQRCFQNDVCSLSLLLLWFVSLFCSFTISLKQKVTFMFILHRFQGLSMESSWAHSQDTLASLSVHSFRLLVLLA